MKRFSPRPQAGVVKAHVAIAPALPRTVHYRGDGQFMLSGREVSRCDLFRQGMLD